MEKEDDIEIILRYDELMTNGYLILSNQCSIDQLMENADDLILPFNPSTINEKNNKEKAINHVLKYFEGTEEYEKCQILKNILDEINKE